MIITKAVEIGGKTITLRELQVRDIMIAPDQVKSSTPEGIPYLLLRCIDLPVEDIADFTFTELAELEAAFMEINTAFFQRAGLVANRPA